jgi:hypothetical protein
VHALVARLLEKEPGARYANAAEVASAIHECIAALGAPKPVRVVVMARPAEGIAQAGRWVQARASEGSLRALAIWRRRPKIAMVAGLGMPEVAARTAKLFQARAREGLIRTFAALRRRPRAAVVAGVGMAAVTLAAAAWSGRTAPSPSVAAAITTVVLPPPPSSQSRALGTSTTNDSPLTCLEGKFADHVDQGRPAGDAKGIAAAHKAIYWVDLANSGDPTQVTLVWTIDGKEVQRQLLGVGHSDHWRTWGSHKVGDSQRIDVRVLDAAGKPLREDSVTLEG